MIAAMPGLPSLAIALRYLAYGVLIAVMLIKPVLAFATEIGELAVPAVAVHDHAQARPDGAAHTAPDLAQQDLAQADPATDHDPDGCGDTQWHLSHCCAMQAALMPRFHIGLPLLSAAAPKPAATTSFVPSPTAVPFRPPISA
jgi:hypothetical protein